MQNTRARVDESIARLGPWFHNLHLPDGNQTAPGHPLGDFPLNKWKQLEARLPANLSGWTALDVGCNAGFYAFELARRGARVVGIDSDEHYLDQARWAAERMGLPVRPEFRQMQVHDLARTNQKFDLVLFMGVFYHLRYPLLALDTIAAKARRLMVFQSLTTGEEQVARVDDDYPLSARKVLNEPGWPRMAFVEKNFANDPTNWWIPSHSAIEAMLRSTGFESVERVAHEIYFCRPPREGIARGRDWDADEWASAVGAVRT